MSPSGNVYISEVFWGNDTYRSFIEIEVKNDIDLSSLMFSGSLLSHQIDRSSDDELPQGQKNTTWIISPDKDWQNR